MTGHRPDQPGTQAPGDSASQNAGADVSADEFAAALKLIVNRLEGQEDGADSPPVGSDMDETPTAVPPTGVLETASPVTPDEVAPADSPWTGLADSMPADPPSSEPEAPSPLAGGLDATPSDSGATTAADLWPGNSPAPDASAEPSTPGDPLFSDMPAPEPTAPEPIVGNDPLFAEQSTGDVAAPQDTPPITGNVFGDDPVPAQPAAAHPSPAPEPAGQDDPLFSDTSQGSGSSDLLNTPMPETGSAGKEPLFADTPSGSGSDDPLFATPSEPDPGGKEPLFVDTPTGDDPLAAASPEPAGGLKEPLFVEQPVDAGPSDPLAAPAAQSADSGKEPLFVDSGAGADVTEPPVSEPSEPAAPAKEPLFVDTASDSGSDPLFAEPGAGSPSPAAEPPAKEPLFVDMPAQGASDPLFTDTSQPSAESDPMAGLRNTDSGPTIGPAMPDPDPVPAFDTSTEPQAAEPLFVDTAAPAEPQTPEPETPEPLFVDTATTTPTEPAATGGLDYPPASDPAIESPHPESRKTDQGSDLGGASNDPFASATRPAFEDDSASALFGDAPDLAAQNAPGSSLGPIGAESADFGKDKAFDEDKGKSPHADGPGDGAAELIATRDLDDDPDGEVELDEILPPLDPAEAASLETAAGPARPKRSLNVGAPVFWLLILALVGGISYWGYQQRHQVAAVGDWAQAKYQLPTGQLSALFSSDPAPDAQVSAAEPAAPVPDVESATPEPASPAVEPVPPPPEPTPPPVAEPTPPPPAPVASPQPEPTPPPQPEPQPRVSEPVAVAAANPPALPEHLAPLPPDATPEIRSLAERARSGDAVAQHDLANKYATGDGVSPNNSYAAYWYRLAGEAGIANAQYNLGVLTTRGLGVRQDQAAAFQLFRSAAESGHADAQTATGLAYMHGAGVTEDRLQAASWFQAASANGRPRGAFHLGQLFELGLDEAPDLAAAAGWYRIAADAGYGEAREALDRLTAATRAAPSPPPAPSSVAAPATTPTPVPPSPDPVPAAPSELVREIQQLLNGFGYSAGPEDGRMGRQTVDAIRSFQASQGLYVTGEASSGLRDLLKTLAAAQ